MMTRWTVCCALVLGALSGCATQRSPTKVSYESEAWKFGDAEGTKLTTEHYEIYTTLRDPVLIQALPAFVEGAYEQYTRLIPPVRTPEERMKVYLFASRGQWAAFTRELTGSRARIFLQVRNGGYSERGVSVIQYVTHSVTFPLFAHEGWHQYLYHCVNTKVPAWLNEGLAVICEGQRWDQHGLKEFDPWYNPLRRNDLSQALIANRLYPLRRLLETHAGEVIQGSTQGVATYYAQLWALILFLREGQHGKYAASFNRMLADLATPQAEQRARTSHIWSERSAFNFGEALFRAYISEELEAVEQEYFAFLRERFFARR